MLLKKYFFIILMMLIWHTRLFAFQYPLFLMNAEEKAASFFKKKDYETAAQLFKEPAWKGSALYRAEQYQDALTFFKQLNHQDGYYNAGNALAKMGHYEEAIQAYDKALALAPDHKDAEFNRDLVKKLLEQKETSEKEQEKNSENKKDSSSNQNNHSNNPSSNQESSDKTPPSQEKSSSSPEKEEAASKEKPLSTHEKEQKEAEKQWLRLVPDNPEGLLHQKLLRDYLKKRGHS